MIQSNTAKVGGGIPDRQGYKRRSHLLRTQTKDLISYRRSRLIDTTVGFRHTAVR